MPPPGIREELWERSHAAKTVSWVTVNVSKHNRYQRDRLERSDHG